LPQPTWKEAKTEEIAKLRPALPQIFLQNCVVVKQETIDYKKFGLKCRLCQGEFILKYREQSFDMMRRHYEGLHA
jgi:hypothetical protein